MFHLSDVSLSAIPLGWETNAVIYHLPIYLFIFKQNLAFPCSLWNRMLKFYFSLENPVLHHLDGKQMQWYATYWYIFISEKIQLSPAPCGREDRTGCRAMEIGTDTLGNWGCFGTPSGFLPWNNLIPTCGCKDHSKHQATFPCNLH